MGADLEGMVRIELITPDTEREPIYQFLVEQMHVHYRRPLDSDHNKYFLQLAEHYSPDKRSSFYVLYENDEVMGTGCISPLEAHHRRPLHCKDASLWGYISRVYISPKSQSSGYGRQISKVLETTAKEFGYTHLCLNTHKFLTKGCAFWKRHGYIEFQDMGDEWETIWLSKELV